MSDFSALVDDLSSLLADDLKKAAPDEGAEPLAKAAHPEPDGDESDDGREPDDDDDDDDADDGDRDELFGKSYTVTLSDGQTREVYDGQAAFQALNEQVQSLHSNQAKTQAAIDQLGQALTHSTALIKSLRAENVALQGQVSQIAASGRGRKSALNIHEKPAVGIPPESPASAPRDLMTKALDAQKAGRLSGSEVAQIDAYLGKRLPIPDALLARLGG